MNGHIIGCDTYVEYIWPEDMANSKLVTDMGFKWNHFIVLSTYIYPLCHLVLESGPCYNKSALAGGEKGLPWNRLRW